MMQTNRVQWVDVAKGMAILWVVALHVGLLGEPNSIFEDIFFRSWTMPFFWIVSGLFLSHQDSFKTFLGKRINNLIVPLCFFVFLTNCMFWVCGDLLGGTDSGWIQRKFHWVSTIQFCWYEGHEDFRNFPLWFLPALFWTSVLYKLIIIISKDKWLWKGLCVALAVSIVIVLSYFSMNLPLFLDDGLYALPYMFFADYVRNKTHFLTSDGKRFILIFIGGGIILFAFLYWLGSYKGMNMILYRVVRYLLAFSGAFIVMNIAKILSFSKFLAYCGRNSLIILGVHLPLTSARPILEHLIPAGMVLNLVLMITVVFCSCIVAFSFNRFCPKLVGKERLLNL